MDPVVIILIILAVLIALLAILFFANVPPFDPQYLAPNPRTWEVDPYPSQENIFVAEREFDFGPYTADFADLNIYNTYRYFFCTYCNLNPTDAIHCKGTGLPSVEELVPGFNDPDPIPISNCQF